MNKLKKLLLLLLFAPLIGLGQDHEEEVFEEAWISVTQMPTLGDCKNKKSSSVSRSDLLEKKACTEKAIMTFIAKNFKYPSLAQKMGVEGRIIIDFVVEKDGKVGRVEIIRSLDPLKFYSNTNHIKLKENREKYNLKNKTISEIIKIAVNEAHIECIKVIESFRLFEPGEQIGKKVPVKYTVPIKMTLG